MDFNFYIISVVKCGIKLNEKLSESFKGIAKLFKKVDILAQISDSISSLTIT